MPGLSDPSPVRASEVPFAEAARFWLQLGCIAFGGPAGQIAIMHRELVERRRWVSDADFIDALNFCMLLPGPEALQLAIYMGWKLHGSRGGVVAGLGFILPAVALLCVLSWVYVRYGNLPVVASVLAGLKAVVVALIAHALVRISRGSLRSLAHIAIALAAFVAVQFLHVPFLIVLSIAALLGLALAWRTPPTTFTGFTAPPPLPPATQTYRVLLVGGLLWLLPLLAVGLTLGAGSLWSRLYLLFTQAALLGFGGAYAVLGYVTQHLVHDLGLLTGEQALAGLALAETTPGPLVIVTQFMGFIVGWNHAAPLDPARAAFLAGMLAAWATFLPSFVLILCGAPYVAVLTANPRIRAALGAITAAVVGVIASLAVLLARVMLFPDGWSAGPRWPALAIAVVALIALARLPMRLPWVLLGAALAGWLVL